MSKNHLIWLALSGIAICSIWQAFVGISYTLSMSWDAFGYYYYLPLTFIEDSLIITSLDDIRPIFEKYDPSSTLYQFSVTDSGNIIIRYPAGQALLYLPFFLIGHLAALVLGYPIDGFSEPYDFAIRAGGVVYNILGFYFISKILRHKNEELLLVAPFQNSSGNYYYRAFDMADNGFSLDRWLITPHVRNESDTLKTYFWNRSKSEVEITQARLMVYAPE
jgi:hypothetical protein